MKGEFSFPGEGFWGVLMTGKKFVRKDNFFQIVNEIGTQIGEQYPCQDCLNFEFFLTFFSPFTRLNCI
jgi:hypothetical protein